LDAGWRKRQEDSMPGGVVMPTEEAIEALMRAYTTAWNNEDIDAIEAFYNVPFFTYQEGMLEVWTDAALSRKADLGWIEVNRREGPATWERLESTVTSQGKNSVLVTTRWVFRRTDGVTVWDFVDTFQLCRFGDDWRFLGRTLHD
jgi:hypothetical protein